MKTRALPWLSRACRILATGGALLAGGCIVSDSPLLVDASEQPDFLRNSTIQGIAWSDDAIDWVPAMNVEAVFTGNTYDITTTSVEKHETETQHDIKFKKWSDSLWILQQKVTADDASVTFKYAAVDVSHPGIADVYQPNPSCGGATAERLLASYGLRKATTDSDCEPSSIEGLGHYFEEVIGRQPGGQATRYRILPR